MQQNLPKIDATEIIKQFVIDNCSPTEPERIFVSGKDGKGGEYNRLKGFLGTSNIFQSGSYARHTSITPLNDLDVFYVLPQQIQYKSVSATKSFLESVALELRKKYQRDGINVVIETQTHSICINFPNKEGDFTIDIIPAYKTNEQNGLGDYFYIIPEIGMVNDTRKRALYKSKKAEDIQWVKTDPKGYKEFVRNLDKASGNRLRRSVKIIKQWKHWQKDQCKKETIEFKLKSFHLELIIAKIWHSNQDFNVLEVLQDAFSGIPKLLDKPSCEDRASDKDNIRYIDDYVTELSVDEKKLIKVRCSNALMLVRMAILATKKSQLEDCLFRITRSNEQFIGTYGFRRNQNTIDGQPFHIEVTNQNKEIFTSGIVPTNNGDKLVFKHVFPKDGFRFLKNQITAYYWKVRNTGAIALKENSLRGEISKNAPRVQLKDGFETTKYKGIHYVECFGVNEQTREILAYAVCSVRVDLENEIVRKQYNATSHVP
jgi:hypothetical protein